MILYVMGAVSIVVGGLTAAGWLLSLTSPLARLRRVTRIRPVTSPLARRQAWNKFGSSTALVLVGAIFLLTALGTTPVWLAGAVLGLLLIWDFGPMVAPHLRRHAAS
jgi:hypothetical protein